jgi:hypothetical protein
MPLGKRWNQKLKNFRISLKQNVILSLSLVDFISYIIVRNAKKKKEDELWYYESCIAHALSYSPFWPSKFYISLSSKNFSVFII